MCRLHPGCQGEEHGSDRFCCPAVGVAVLSSLDGWLQVPLSVNALGHVTCRAITGHVCSCADSCDGSATSTCRHLVLEEAHAMQMRVGC